MRVGVLDLGSNTFHLLVASVDSDGGIVKLGSLKHTLKLGAQVAPGGVIGEEPWNRAMAAIDDLLAFALPFDCPILAVATSVFRDAANGRAFAEAVRLRFGVFVELLSGAEEARLAYLGATSGLALRGRTAVVDVGGGSIQFTVGEGDRCLFARSLPLGVLRLCKSARAETLDARQAALAIGRNLRRETHLVVEEIAEWNPQTLVFASGTARTIASLPVLGAYEAAQTPRLPESSGIIETMPMAGSVSRGALAGLGTALMGLDSDSLLRLGVPADRHGTAGPGAVVLSTIMDLLGFEQATIATRALREGAIVRALSNGRDARSSSSPVEAAPAA